MKLNGLYRERETHNLIESSDKPKILNYSWYRSHSIDLLQENCWLIKKMNKKIKGRIRVADIFLLQTGDIREYGDNWSKNCGDLTIDNGLKRRIIDKGVKKNTDPIFRVTNEYGEIDTWSGQHNSIGYNHHRVSCHQPESHPTTHSEEYSMIPPWYCFIIGMCNRFFDHLFRNAPLWERQWKSFLIEKLFGDPRWKRDKLTWEREE